MKLRQESLQERRRRVLAPPGQPPRRGDDWRTDKEWADRYWPEIERIIRRVIGEVATVRPTGAVEDGQLARDYVVERWVVACRLRRLPLPWRDFTVRRWRKSGAKTELAKIRQGLVRWYLYAWADDTGIREWWLIDCEPIRTNRIPAAPRPAFSLRTNPDGNTGFIAFQKWWLDEIGAIVRRWPAA